MPMEEHRDRYFVAPGKPTSAQIRAMMDRTTRKDSAIRAINNYFQALIQMRSLEHITLDALVQHCFNLLAVASYVDFDEQEEYSRRKEIKNHISMKIKEYIDGKL